MKKVKEGLAEARQSPMSIETLVHWFSQNIEVTPQEVDRETFKQATEIVQETENGKICLVPPNPNWEDLKKITTSLRASELDDDSREKYEKIHEAEYDFLRKVAKYLADLDTDKLKGSKKMLYEEIKNFFAEIGSFAKNQEEINLTEEDKEEIESFLLGRNIYEKQKARFESRKAEGKSQEPWEKLMAKKLEKVLNILNEDFDKIPVISKGKVMQSQFIDGLIESAKPSTEFMQNTHDIGTEQLLQDTKNLSLTKGFPTIKEIIEENIPTENKIRKIVEILNSNFNYKSNYGSPLLARKNKETHCVGFTTLGKHLEKLNIDYCPFIMYKHVTAFALDNNKGYFIDIVANIVTPLTAEDFSRETTGIDWETWKAFVQGKRTDWQEFTLPAKITEHNIYKKNNHFQSEIKKESFFMNKHKDLFSTVLFNIGAPTIDNTLSDKMKEEYNKQALACKYKQAYFNYGNLLATATDPAVRNEKKAAKMYEKAIKAGIKVAYLNYGILLANAIDPAVRNEQKAAKMYEKAIKVGDKDAYFNCAHLLVNATDSAVKNYQKALKYYKKFMEAYKNNKEEDMYMKYAKKQIEILEKELAA